MAELQADFIAGTDKILVVYRNDPEQEWKSLVTLDAISALQLARLLTVRAENLLRGRDSHLPVKAVVLKTGREI